MRPVSQIERRVAPFEVVSPYQPSGDQPTAIDELERRIRAGEKDVVLLGATGTGKSATTAWMIERLQRPTLVMAPNKTLAAQLANEFRELLPNNAVEYFVSYYDYYQPEAYVPQTDTFIEKDSSINAEVERLRHSTTNSLLSRRDVVVVSTVSCIYGLGAAEGYLEAMVALQVGQNVGRDALIRRFVGMQYERNDVDFSRGKFRVRGDTIEIIPMYEEHAVRIELFGDEIEALYSLHPLTGEVLAKMDAVSVFPATHYAASPATMQRAIGTIQTELHDRLVELEPEVDGVRHPAGARVEAAHVVLAHHLRAEEAERETEQHDGDRHRRDRRLQDAAAHLSGRLDPLGHREAGLVGGRLEPEAHAAHRRDVARGVGVVAELAA